MAKARDFSKEAADLVAEVEGTDAPKTGFQETEPSKSARHSAAGWMGAAAPMLGSAAGAFAGPAIGAALGVTRIAPFILGGEMVGGGVGEIANQAFGITEPNKLAVGLNTLAPAVGRTIAGVPQFLLREMPGANRAIRAGFVDAAHVLPTKHINPPSSKQLYSEIPLPGQPGAFRVTSMPETQQTLIHLQDEIKNPIKALESAEYGSKIQPVLEGIDQALSGTPAKFKTMPASGPDGKPFSLKTGLPSSEVKVTDAQDPGFDLNEIIKVKEGIGKLVGDTADGRLRGAYRQLYRSILDDLEHLPAPAGSAVETWKKAQQSYKLERAQNDLAEVIERNIKSVEGIEQFQADPVRNWIRNNKDFQARVGPKKLAAIDKELENIAAFTGKRDTKLLSILVGAASGGTVGAMGGYVAADAIANALLSPGARKIFTKLATANQGRALRDAGGILAAAQAGALGNTPEE